MANVNRIVSTEQKVPSDRLPQWANEGAVLAESLEAQGILDQVDETLLVQREGGYTARDIFLFFLFFFGSGFLGGIKEFGNCTRLFRPQIAALGGRKRFAAPSSVSRFLSAVEMENTNQFDSWLFFDACGANAVLSHPSTWTRDTQGETWHVFDLDASSTVLRHRALPSMEGLPEGKRRSHECKPGYSGRKRGEVQLSRMALQHAGSGLWIGLWTGPGNGLYHQSLKAATERVGDVCERLGHPKQRALIRLDGAGASRFFLTSCQANGVCYLTRWCAYDFLNETAVRRYLNEATWYEVPDSGSGPRRQAAELGWMTIPPTEGTKRPDGQPYEPVVSRFVVSRFPIEKKHGAGLFIDGWQYELYATNLDPNPWPAPEVVMTYYGRCGQENRFRQEDRELALDRIFSYHIPGQHLANIIGLFIWNLRICRGMDLCQPPTTIPSQPSRKAVVIESPVKLAIVPLLNDEANQSSHPTSTTDDAMADDAMADDAMADDAMADDAMADDAMADDAMADDAMADDAMADDATASDPCSHSLTANDATASASGDVLRRPSLATDADTASPNQGQEPSHPSPAKVVSITSGIEDGDDQRHPSLAANADTASIMGEGKKAYQPIPTAVAATELVNNVSHCHLSLTTDADTTSMDQGQEPSHQSPTANTATASVKEGQEVHHGPAKTKLISECSMSSSADGPFDPLQPLLPALDALEWPSILARKIGWTWDSKRGGLLCPNGTPLPLAQVKISPTSQKGRLRFVARLSACKYCKLRTCCTASTCLLFRKELFVPVPFGLATSIQTILLESRKIWRPVQLESIQRRELSTVEKMLQSWKKPSTEDAIGMRAVHAAILLPAEVRKHFLKLCFDIETHVIVILPEEVNRSVPVFATTAAERQHRRLTWRQRHQRNELPDGAQVRTKFMGGAPLAGVLP